MKRSLKPQDILILGKILSDPLYQQKDIASKIFLSSSEVSLGIQSLISSNLLSSKNSPNYENILEFLVHSLKYFYPPELGTLSVGIRTAHSHEDFKDQFDNSYVNIATVWPLADGDTKGISLKPIYPTLPMACQVDAKLYHLFSLIEMIRSGKAREKNFATEKLSQLLKSLAKANTLTIKKPSREKNS